MSHFFFLCYYYTSVRKGLHLLSRAGDGRRIVSATFSLVICKDKWCFTCCPASIKLPLTLLGFRQAEVNYEAWPTQFTMRQSNNFTSLSHCVSVEHSFLPFHFLSLSCSKLSFITLYKFSPILVTLLLCYLWYSISWFNSVVNLSVSCILKFKLSRHNNISEHTCLCQTLGLFVAAVLMLLLMFASVL